jgi:hypothetical protein
MKKLERFITARKRKGQRLCGAYARSVRQVATYVECLLSAYREHEKSCLIQCFEQKMLIMHGESCIIPYFGQKKPNIHEKTCSVQRFTLKTPIYAKADISMGMSFRPSANARTPMFQRQNGQRLNANAPAERQCSNANAPAPTPQRQRPSANANARQDHLPWRIFRSAESL